MSDVFALTACTWTIAHTGGTGRCHAAFPLDCPAWLFASGPLELACEIIGGWEADTAESIHWQV